MIFAELDKAKSAEKVKSKLNSAVTIKAMVSLPVFRHQDTTSS